MNTILEQINSAGYIFVEFALPMLVQSSVLIVVLLLVDLLLRKKVRAVFRYWLWMLVLLKLILPTTLSSPVSLGSWFGDELATVKLSETSISAEPVRLPQMAQVLPAEEVSTPPAVTPTAGVRPIVTPVSGTKPVVSPAPVTWQGIVFLVWATGVAAMGLLLLQRAIFACGLVAQAKNPTELMNDAFRFCCGQMGLKGKVGLKVSANTTSPAVCGLFRPVILLPQNLAPALGSSRLRPVLLHELAHISRGDLWVNLAQTILQIIYFYNPLLWLANSVIRRIREQAVDEAVQVAMGAKAKQYPQTLVDVAKMAFNRPVLSLRLIGVVESKSALKGRIKRMLNRPIPKTAKLGILGLIALLIFAAVLLPMAKGLAGPPELVIRGTVTDAETGEPIAGAKVFDDGYGPEPDWTKIQPDKQSEWGAITNSAGKYSFLTWPEHHSIKVEAPAYKAKKESLYSGHFTLNKKDEEIFDFALEPEEAAQQTEFKAALPSGVTVELVAVCENPNKAKWWWKPDGTLLEEAPYDRLEGNPYLGGYEFLLKLDGPSDTAYRWEIEGAGSERTCKPMDKNGKVIEGLLAQVVQLTSAKESTDVRVGIAAGRWNTNTRFDMHGLAAIGMAGGGVIFNQPYESEGKTTLIVAHTFPKLPVRVVAIGHDGSLHNSYPGSSAGVGGMMQTLTCQWDLPLSEIKEVWFQTKEFNWVEFKNVSLKAGNKTNVKVALDANQLRAESEEKGKYELPVIDTSELSDLKDIKHLSIGDVAPEFETKTLDGKVLKLSDFRGKYVLLDFWATWCTPCLGKIPYLVDVYDNFGKDKRFAMIGLSLDHDIGTLKEYISKTDLKWIQGFLGKSSSVQADYGVQGIPSCFLVGPEGKIIDKDLRGEQLKLAIAKALGMELVQKTDVEIAVEQVRTHEEISEGKKEERPDIRAKKAEIAAKLATLENQRVRVQRDLNVAERALAEVRDRWGFSDLEEHSYPHPVTERLNRLQREKDDLVLEISQLQANIKNLREKGDNSNLIKAQERLVELQAKLDTLEKMRAEAAARKRDLDMARIAYKQRTAIRDERIQRLNELKSQIEKFRLMYENPAAFDVELEVEETSKAGIGTIDVAAEDFRIRPYPAGGLYTVTVAIRNKGSQEAPSFRLNFYQGDPANNLNLHRKPQTGSHGAGPIKSGSVWNEGSSPFALKEGLNEIVVVLDTDQSVAESDETNNRALMRVVVKDGRIIEKSVSYSPQQKKVVRSRLKTNVQLEGQETIRESNHVDLLKRYPTTISDKDAEPENARPWQFSKKDIYYLSNFSLDVGDELKVRIGPGDLGIGHCKDGAVWVVIIPRRKGTLSSSVSKTPEVIDHLWLRFHPAEINSLFSSGAVRQGADADLWSRMNKIATAKMRSSWQAGGWAMIPGRKDMTVDADTEKGIRRFFVVDREANSARYVSAFENRVVPAGEIDKNRPMVVKTQPAAFANDVSPSLKTITVTFDQPMMDRSWSWTGGGDTYPETTGRPRYDSSRTTCSLPVKLEPGKVYWVGINSPSYKNFKNPDRVPAKRYVILFATKGTDGRATPIPSDMLVKAKSINSLTKTKKKPTRHEPAGLQGLIDSVKPGDTVTVPKGVYTEPIEINKSLTLKGESRTECVLEVTANRPAVFIDTKGKGKVVVQDLTIKWQLATSDKNIEYPFALGVKDTKAEVKNCYFQPLGNFQRSPVAIRAVGFSNLTIDGCRFEGFEYVVCYGEGTEGITQDCLIMDCGHQGIINYSGSTLRVERNVITGSRYHAVRSTGGTLFMKDNLIINNANRGVYLGNKSARGSITNNIIMGSGTGIGGFAQSRVKIENNLILDSSYAGIGMRDSCSLMIRNNIFQGNERGWILFKKGSKGGNAVYRNTFWKNKVDAENFRKTANSITAEPRFADPDNGDFSLKSGPALEHKQGLTNPQLFKTLWKIWQNRANKNEPFSGIRQTSLQVSVGQQLRR